MVATKLEILLHASNLLLRSIYIRPIGCYETAFFKQDDIGPETSVDSVDPITSVLRLAMATDSVDSSRTINRRLESRLESRL